ncbi:MAG TPA: tripartite tricarboxylate transporter substrate binding protein [Caldimonas sp.]|jgi:tripartite-type tricarboxylate transporter receptor subunit TctC|nr:tripartite tricarboxylate transporter substrate binding protein [Caldimonas sp.]HEX2542868.1 tripartite tricarboxylate transporter substrate binding protein [Caldimonas sp.]
MKLTRFLVRSVAIAGFALCAVAPAAAQTSFPSKPVTLVVAFPPGGGADLLGRLLASKYEAAWGQPVVVTNRPGAAGTIGANEVARAAPDGHTLLVGAIGAVVPSNQATLAPVSLLSAPPYIVAVNSSLPVNNLRELAAYAKARPDGSVSYGSSGAASASHLAGELFQGLTQTKLTHVPYKGMGQAVNDLIGGQVTIMFGPPPVLLPHIKSGRLKALAVTDTKRSPLFPDIPTAVEAGVPGLEARAWYGIFAPAGTPAAVISKINADTAKALAAPDLVETLAGQGATPIGGDVETFTRYLKEDIVKWDNLLRKAGLPSQ